MKRLLFLIAVAAVISASSVPSSALAQDVDTDIAVFRQPRYKIEAIGFNVLDETGWDFWGGDDAVTFFFRYGSPPTLAVTQKFENVDSDDDTHFYKENERCIIPRRVIRNIGASQVLQAPDDAWDCNPEGSAAPLRFIVTMYEDDRPDRFPYCFTGPSRPGFEIEGKDCQDDLIGQADVSFGATELVAMMPRVDNTFVGSVILEDEPCQFCPWTGPKYQFGFRITRLPDRLIQPPILSPD